ncbi:MAG TPA: malto-oligosyltrehalose trehalohydrolase [Pirellulales bacterium]|nr:malto-oligosyltrehalose trehalohydrolase [Pirellulales bacterium]
MNIHRRYPIGAEIQPTGGTHFRVWAPDRASVEVVLECSAKTDPRERTYALAREPDGYFSGMLAEARAGCCYRFRLDGGEWLMPDPMSRFQPDGPHGPSEIIDPSQFAWTDAKWPGCDLLGQVIYEMHIGTFTREGTWAAAIEQLPELARVGITVLELMPVADFPGEFGWGYDGVDFFAPTRLYGRPDEMRRFVDQAHALGMGVILDVVYNHIGPDGNYLISFSQHYHTDRYANEWGQALNFDGEQSGPVREFFSENAAYWIDEYHLDGLRLDATQQIFDASPEHIMTVIGRRVREAAAGRRTIVVAENECQHSKIVRSVDKGGYGLDGLWNDDFHHSAQVALTGHNEAYYTDYRGDPQEFVSALKWGYLFQGQRYQWQQKRRGTPALDLSPHHFVTFLENHDQIANSGTGFHRWQLASPGRLKALTALFLLGPGTPMLFQGQEFASASPFFYFADHHPELAALVSAGRKKFLAQFPTLGLPEIQARLPDPADRRTFERCKLNFLERETHGEWYALHRDLLRLRRTDPAFKTQRNRGLDGAVLGNNAFVLRFFSTSGDDRLVVVNLGRDLHLDPAPEPLLAPPEQTAWTILWSSEDFAYGGVGTAPLDSDQNWRLPGESAVVLRPEPLAEPPPDPPGGSH